MRVIGQVHGESRARVFSDFLVVQGIENEIEAGHDDHWSVWVNDEAHLEQAGGLLEEFQSNPDHPKYTGAVTKANELKQKSAEEQKAWERRLKNRRHLFQPLRGYGFGMLTFVLMIASGVVFIWSGFGLDTRTVFDRIGFLFISEFVVPGGPLERLSGLEEIRRGEIWRLFTPMLIHFGPIHFIFNMLWLRDLGSMIEDRQSTIQLALLVFVIAALSNFGQYLWSGPAFGGMSGVVYGLLGYIWIRGKFDPASGLFLHQSTVIMMLVWFVICFTGFMPIANTAHTVGLLTGMAWGFLASLKHR